MKHNSYLKARWFERLIAELEQSLEQMTDNDLERIIFICWAEQQERCSSEAQQNRMKEDEEKACSEPHPTRAMAKEALSLKEKE